MKVLVIDDIPAVLKQLDKCLSTAEAPGGEHYKVTCASDHTEALGILAAERFDVVITDMVMGSDEEEGLAVLRELTEKSPVTIVLTARSSIPNCVAAMRAGAWDYIEKAKSGEKDPYDRLLASLDAACRHRKDHPETGKASPDAKWIHGNLGWLMTKYPGEIVAVLDQKVVGNAPSYDELTKQLAGRFPLTRPTIISIPDTTVDAVE